MSVTEMRDMLGLGKTEAYWLVKKGYFQTVQVGNNIRIIIESFEKWYSKQTHYLKVDGEKPGVHLKKTISSKELADILGISVKRANDLANRGCFKTSKEGQYHRIDTASFEEWYTSQFRYRKVNGEKPGTAFPDSISPREMADLLDVPLHNTVYDIIKINKLETFMADGQRRIILDSFLSWYENQNKYSKKKVEDS